MISFKWYYSNSLKKILSFKEIYNQGYESFSRMKEFEENNLSLIEFDENELITIVKEFQDYLMNNFAKNNIYKKNNDFVQKLISSSKDSNLHSKKIDSSFAINHLQTKQMKNLFD